MSLKHYVLTYNFWTCSGSTGILYRSSCDVVLSTKTALSRTVNLDRMDSHQNAIPSHNPVCAYQRTAMSRLARSTRAADHELKPLSHLNPIIFSHNGHSCILRTALVYADHFRCSPRKEALPHPTRTICQVDIQLCPCMIVRPAPSYRCSYTSYISGATRLRCTAHRHTVVC